MNFKALFLGYAIGDAYGAGVEFQDRHWIREHVDFTKLVNARDMIVADVPDPHMFTEHYFPWDYSDDTEMTLGLAKALMSGLPFTEDLLLDYWRKEYETGVRKKIVSESHCFMAILTMKQYGHEDISLFSLQYVTKTEI